MSEACKLMQVVNAEPLGNAAAWNCVPLRTCRTRGLKKSLRKMFWLILNYCFIMHEVINVWNSLSQCIGGAENFSRLRKGV